MEILFFDFNNKKWVIFIILQIVIINLNLICSQYLIFSNVIGWDPWNHQWFTLNIVNNGFIPTGVSYSNLAVMHVEIASTSIITGLNYKIAALFSITFFQVLCGILFTFLLGKFLFNAKIGLLASLFLAIGNYYINMGLYIIPNSIAAIIILIIIYLIFTLRKKNFYSGTSLVIIFMIILILTHTLSAMCMAIILFVMLTISYCYNKVFQTYLELPVTFNLAAFFSIAMFSWWIYSSGHIQTLAAFIQKGFNRDLFIQAPLQATNYINTVPFSETIFNASGLLLFFSITILGCFYMISKKYGNFNTFNIALVGLIPLTLGFFSQILGIYILPERWIYFSQVLLAIPIVITVILIYNNIKNKSIRSIVLLIIIFFFSFILILSPTANVNNRFLSPNTGIRNGYTEAEMTSTAFFVEKSVGNLSSDFDFFTNPSSSIPKNYFELKSDRIKSIDESLLTGDFTQIKSTIVIREEIVKEPFRLFGAIYKLNYDLKNSLEKQGFSLIYDCKSVFGYI
ncbi:MAG: hypothetical protein IMZ41_03610 [Actinobacteria bacterium]|nr:hypothetical protein [Actinomycetota bacterium]